MSRQCAKEIPRIDLHMCLECANDRRVYREWPGEYLFNIRGPVLCPVDYIVIGWICGMRFSTRSIYSEYIEVTHL